MAAAADILEAFDQACADLAFPMLDNGYYYLAAIRLSLFRSPTDWAVVFERFAFSPRVGLPDLTITTFGGAVAKADEYVSIEPLADGAWRDPDELDLVSDDPDAAYVLRGTAHRVPERWEYARWGIALEDPERIHVHELARCIALRHRDDVLATGPERRAHVAEDMDQLLVLDDWHHPDLAGDERPSDLDSFQQLARVLETGDAHLYRPTKPGNTHWKNWPQGGSL